MNNKQRSEIVEPRSGSRLHEGVASILRKPSLILSAAFIGGVVLVNCTPRNSSPALGTESHFLVDCDQDSDCGGRFECLGGRCSVTCDEDDDCQGLGVESVCLPTPGQSGRSCDVPPTVTSDDASTTSTTGAEPTSSLAPTSEASGDASTPVTSASTSVPDGNSASSTSAASDAGEPECTQPDAAYAVRGPCTVDLDCNMFVDECGCGCYPDEDSGAATSLLENARAEYVNWSTRTTEPVNISAEIFSLCRLPTLAENDFADSIHGNELYLLDWLNPAAQASIANIEAQGESDASVPTFAVGATIVKEKLVRTGAGYELAALGIMIKREPGFDPTYGDWQFGYWEPEPGMLSGSDEQAYCGSCHAVAPTDFVYLDESWRMQ